MLIVGTFAHAPEHFGSQHDLFAPTATLGQPAPDNLFGNAFTEFPTVNIRRVEKVNAQFQRSIHDGKAVGLGGLRAEVHRAQRQAADFKAGTAKMGIFDSHDNKIWLPGCWLSTALL
jgi:hypothetical protein